MNANAILEWVKANVFIVVFVVLMIAAPITMFFVSSGIGQDVRESVNRRSQKITELARLEKSEIDTFGGQSVQGVLNEQYLRRYEQVARTMSEDAAAVQKAALEHNRKGRGVVMEGVFPSMPVNMRDVLPQQFHEALMAAYQTLLHEIQAGAPPTLESMRDELTTARIRFITQDLRKTATDELEPQEQKLLSEELSKIRMSHYADAANSIGLYVTLDQLGVPSFEPARQPSTGEMFSWQWQYWITEDLLKALRQANGSERVNVAPVKHIRAVSITGLPSGGEDTESGGGQYVGGGGFGAGGGGGAVGMDAPEGEGAPAAGGSMPNPKTPTPQNFGESPITGRVSNPLYDVIHVGVDLVVDSARLPAVLDELARYNFMTVVAMELNAADPFEAAQGGFYYGPAPVTAVRLQLETVWLREWTIPFMPDSVKKELGISTAAGASGSPEQPM